MDLEGLSVENWHRTGKARESGKERVGWTVEGRPGKEEGSAGGEEWEVKGTV